MITSLRIAGHHSLEIYSFNFYVLNYGSEFGNPLKLSIFGNVNVKMVQVIFFRPCHTKNCEFIQSIYGKINNFKQHHIVRIPPSFRVSGQLAPRKIDFWIIGAQTFSPWMITHRVIFPWTSVPRYNCPKRKFPPDSWPSIIGPQPDCFPPNICTPSKRPRTTAPEEYHLSDDFLPNLLLLGQLVTGTTAFLQNCPKDKLHSKYFLPTNWKS